MEQTSRNNAWKLAGQGRMQCEQVFPFGRESNDQAYTRKRVRPIFVETDSEIVVATVYTFFFEDGEMKITHDAEVDALSIVFRETTVTTELLADGMAADYGSEGRFAGIEILDAHELFGSGDALRQVEVAGLEQVLSAS